MPTLNIKVVESDFDAGAELKQLHNGNSKIGAACSFVGFVREFGDKKNILAMELEHYPGMTERALQDIAEEASDRWALSGVTVIHRVGYLKSSEQIVLVICAGAHRKAVFAGCEFIMDFLKVKAPFWKKEVTPEGATWVKAKDGDEQHAKRWSLS